MRKAAASSDMTPISKKSLLEHWLTGVLGQVGELGESGNLL
jgi:hypothetical protein